MPVPRGTRVGGRQKGTPNKVGREVRELAQKHGPKIIQGLVEMANDEKTPHAARVSASKEVLDRAYGRPAQTIVGDPENPIVTRNRIEIVIVDPKSKG